VQASRLRVSSASRFAGAETMARGMRIWEASIR
jgi:hypothetical protein